MYKKSLCILFLFLLQSGLYSLANDNEKSFSVDNQNLLIAVDEENTIEENAPAEITEDSVEDNFFENLEHFRADELEEIFLKRQYPLSENNFDKVVEILNNYDLKQPSQEFSLNKKLRIASFNVNRGYNLEKLKLALKPDPIFEELNAEFPETENAETLNQALKAIIKTAQKNNWPSGSRTKVFYAYLRELMDSEESQFMDIVTSMRKVNKAFLRKNWRRTYSHVYEIAKELNHLAHADIIALQEIDWGMPRSNYANVTKELANELGYGYVYGTEFIELLDDGLLYSKINNLDEEAFKGLHGNAILSKWPLENVRIIRYAEDFTTDTNRKEMKHRRCYDWWKEELPKIGPFEKLIYKFGKIVFNEEAIVPSVRLGSRMALVADVSTPAGPVTVASTHLENRGSPKCRRYELEELLNELKSVTNQPLVVAGDFNTTNEEARRPYFIHVLYWYIKNQFELSTLIANIGTNVGMFFLDLPFPIPAPIPATVQLFNQAREWRNPAGIGSAERKFFRKVIEKFQFDDGAVIDTRGKQPLNPRGSTRILSNSNQTTPMGYKPTYCFQRNYKHLFCMKLDWILVKGNLSPATRASKKCKVCPDNTWAPTNPRTLYYSMLAGQVSDHAAITTDLILPEDTDLP